MTENPHTVLCVDDEKNILHSLKRLLRKEGYRLLTCSSGREGLRVLAENPVHLVICDQRMPEMSGIEFLSRVRGEYPDVIRICLTGYTDVDSITESINQGHIYKFFLKPWNDQNLKLEIRQALEQYDLIMANRQLHETVLKQNRELQAVNENLESLVKERTQELEIKNQALELSRTVLEDLPFPIAGISREGMIVLLNRGAHGLEYNGQPLKVGASMRNVFGRETTAQAERVIRTHRSDVITGQEMAGRRYDIETVPLGGAFKGRGCMMVFVDPMGPVPGVADPGRNERAVR